ncbi:LPS assembly lipoprotein LptE [Hydrogenophaga sp.]|uniref:LPS-assembly lipoprotein LptE n=1 Tax=Hydrogenophaga sp. TaxID=1904254 RepID=UPI0019CB0A9E|nr:LPS assembly lipoprotein LptE [Hydrogenophaga sp.]MBD3892701.1 hypothetical protein [Hydrogenophaga sp.]
MNLSSPVAPLAPTRRRLLRALTLGGAALLGLSGCGFVLRGTPRFAFESLRVQGHENTPVTRELRAALSAAGLRVLTHDTPANAAAAQVVLNVMTDQRERTVVGQTAAGQVRELLLRTRFRFSLRRADGQELLPETELLLERPISFTEGAVLAKEAEEAQIYRDMQTDLVRQLMRRLAAVPAR